ncbi:ribonuclease H1-like isoform X2 [Corticium candelabrum]|uniref:ribonuclease H1-like isoform X2 n=1 Tax=Corticium candelabrum TaxID=121492 RepID=UPI002E263B3E|nr:ribonuclease H1-like isoform X2 [Corticium candelabrum]
MLIARTMSFYAVRRGRIPGIYRTWAECNTQVLRYSGASFKKFRTLNDANAFIDENSDCKKLRQLEDFVICEMKDVKEVKDDCVVVYTDGSCENNGKCTARAGIGVFWGPAHPLNASERLVGKQTNQRAEIVACCRALEIAKEQNIAHLEIRTDSQFVINAITMWIERWKENGWKTQVGGDVKNMDDFKRLEKLTNTVKVKWTHVNGHCGVFGNEEADKLARNGGARSY